MDQRALAKLFPRETLESYVRNETRESGRPLGRSRAIVIKNAELTNANGSVIVKLGETLCMCSSRMELVEPTAKKADEGLVELSVEICAVSRERHRHGRSGDRVDRACFVRDFLSRVLFDCDGDACDGGEECIIDKRKLSITKGMSCWKLVCECFVVSDDAGECDACLAAICACLRTTEVPLASVSARGETKLIGGEEEVEKGGKRVKAGRLEINREFKPVCVTTGAFNLYDDDDNDDDGVVGKKRKKDDGGEKKNNKQEREEEEEDDDDDEYQHPPKQIAIVDPDYEEMKLCDALVHVIVDQNGDVLGLEKCQGSSAVDETILAKAIQAAKLRHASVWKRIDQLDIENNDEEDAME